ncbi:type I glutamate--ammonia ligase [bacterium (Candidatus Gribaldobacteria) CG_4_8_14_3_um_filter_42_11]|uniref:Glutamine synthetase n=1 Tax=bacterium (Candidatus Gribaldobacteria) CG_4_8_14_3_um_filter_42_11 TaxID=2014267 RepID=A0A2M7IXE1_9BACT|nr:MAG: type I glutamate--ammonia ligase [bacterium (Candidatus Gribaldobacteria) CG_4_8_14_3_um_filter_42_11]
MTSPEILQKVKKDEARFFSLQFADLLGVIKEVVKPIAELASALEQGVWFDGSSVEGFARIQESDMFLKPDPDTYAVLPWTEGKNKTIRFICDIYQANGQPYESDPRFVLKKAIQSAQAMGFQYTVGPEPEFYLFEKNDSQESLPLDKGGYFDWTYSRGIRVAQEATEALKSFGVNVECLHHEVGEGQYEIDFNYGSALEIADKLLTLRYVVKKIADFNGLKATFMPKPIKGMAGSGMHVRQSLFSLDGQTNLFSSDLGAYRLADLAKSFLAGQLKYIKEICLTLCPTVNSYKRLISGFEAPVYITWASSNRSALIRVPKWFSDKPKAARIELRCPDSSSNPYLAFTAMLAAGLAGIEQNLAPTEPVEENVYHLDEANLKNRHIATLPGSLFEALAWFGQSELMKKILGEELFNRYLSVKQKEWNEFKTEVCSWELDKYSNIY